MNMENNIYLAYGSNLNLEQMEFRCPYATVLGTAVLPDYQLVFRGGATSAVATIEPKKGAVVPVLLWDITPRDEEALDRYEGWPYLYRKETIRVKVGKKKISAMVYIMNEGRPLGQPSKLYLDTILQGYESAGFNKEALNIATTIRL